MKQLFKSIMFVSVASIVAFSASAADGEKRESPAAVTAITAEDIAKFTARPVDELVTSARRTEENVLDVPIAATILSADTIERGGILNNSDIAAFTPGLSFGNYFGDQIPRPVIRGVSPLDILADEQNVGVYIDNIFVSTAGTSINFALLDLERIEVLKGPQGAYFGNGAFSGAINYVTARPSDEFRIKTDLTVGDYQQLRAKVSLEGPVVGDQLSGRISFLYDDFGGTYDNASALDQDIGGYKYKTVASSLFWEPSDNFSAQWNVYISDDAIDPGAQSTVSANCQTALNDPTNPGSRNPDRFKTFCGEIPSVGKNDIATVPGETGQVRELTRTTLRLDLGTDIGTFSSLTGYTNTKSASFDNGRPGGTNTTYAYLGDSFIPGFTNLTYADFGGQVIQSFGKSDDTNVSQELRWTSPVDRRARYTIGAFYQEFEEKDPGVFPFVRAENDLPADFQGFCPFCVNIFPGAWIKAFDAGDAVFGSWFTDMPSMYAGLSTSKIRDYAGFGSVEFDITDQWTGYADIRYTDRSVKNNSTTIDYGDVYDISTDSFTGPAPINTSSESIDTDYTTWRVSLSYAPTDLSNIYGSIATGQKGGGIDSFNIAGTGDPMLDGSTVNTKFDVEKNITYELGYKAAFDGGRTVIDTAIYYIDWKDIVIPTVFDSIPDPMNPGMSIPIQPVSISDNAGDASVKGVEFSVNTLFSDNLDGGLGVSYNRAELDKGQIETFSDWPAFAPNGDMSGQTLPRQPELQVNGNLTFRNEINANWGWYARGDAFYQSRWYVGLPNFAQIPSRVRANARFGLESERYTIEIFARNLFDDDSVEAAFQDPYFTNTRQSDGISTGDFSTFFPARLSTTQATRRTVGLTFRARFGG